MHASSDLISRDEGLSPCPAACDAANDSVPLCVPCGRWTQARFGIEPCPAACDAANDLCVPCGRWTQVVRFRLDPPPSPVSSGLVFYGLCVTHAAPNIMLVYPNA